MLSGNDVASVSDTTMPTCLHVKVSSSPSTLNQFLSPLSPNPNYLPPPMCSLMLHP